MCGIGGILRVWPPDQRDLALRTPHDQSIPEQWLDILDDAVKHRGPDGQGRFRDRALRADGCVVDVAFVHRRLSIIDHAGGHQPMVLEVPKGALSASSGSDATPQGRPIPGRLLSIEELNAHNRRVLAEAHIAEHTGAPSAPPELALGALSSHDRIAVVFNGCIYNHRELRAELQRAGHVFSTDHSDTEVLVHGWREWNLDLCAALDGMFAFALWDARNATVTIARDYAGEKPLYVAGLEDIYPSDNSEAWAGTLAFASTPAGLFHLCTKLGRELPVNKTVLHWLHNGYARFCAPVDEFPVATISDIVSYRNHKKPTSIIPRGWPETLATHVRSPRNIRLTTDDTDHLLNDVIVSRLSADVPLGCFLSGGVDSSLVAHYAKAALGEVHTFTVRMPDARYDESAVAQRVAAILGTRHETLDTNPDPTADLQSLITQLGLPFGDSSLLPTYWVSRATRNHVKVALTGDGADELFGGYERQLAARWLPLARRLALFFPRRSFDSPDPKSRRHKVHRLFEAALGWQYADLAAITPARLLHRLLGTDINPLTSWSKITYYGGPEIEEAMNHDFRHYLPGDILRKTDTASMSVALEARAPFLALDTIRAARAAPIASLMPHGQRKGLLRQVARKYLPPEIVDRPKMGFAIPIGEWFRSDYGGLRTMLLDHLNSTEPFGPPSLGIDLNMKFIRQMLDEHLGTGPSGRVVRDHSQRLYMLLVLSIWAKWLGGLGKSA